MTPTPDTSANELKNENLSLGLKFGALASIIFIVGVAVPTGNPITELIIFVLALVCAISILIAVGFLLVWITSTLENNNSKNKDVVT